jgi:hypothetical protein
MWRAAPTLLLAGLAACAAGCGAETGPAPAPGAAATGDAAPPAPPANPEPAADPYQMDPGKHVVPDRPAAGRLSGKTFTPDRVELHGRTLTLRQGKDFFADLEVAIDLRGDDKTPPTPVKLTVRPDQKWTDRTVPSLATKVRDGQSLPKTEFIRDGYALTLELGGRDKGEVPGKIYLCLPDDQKSYLAGTFRATWVRPATAPPGPDEVPFIQGTVGHPGKPGQMLTVGYVGRSADGKPVSDLAGVGLPEGGGGGWVQSNTFRPRTATLRFEKGVPRFDFARLPPGRYLVYAKLKDGPSVWRWVDVPADGQLTLDLAIDPSTVGAVEVTAPAGLKGKVRLAPTDPGSDDRGAAIAAQLGFSLGYEAELKDGKGTIPNVPAGTYRVEATDHPAAAPAEVEVAAGETAAVELRPVKK